MIVEQKIAIALEGPLKDKGFEIVKINYVNKNLQIFIEKDGDNISISDCQKASKLVSTLLDVEDIIKERYNLELSSPGLDRPLVKITDYTRYINKEAKVILKEKVNDRKKIKGKILAVKDNKVTLSIEGEDFNVDYDNISSANLIPEINFNGLK